MKKYELTNITKIVSGRTLYQIKASMSFGTVIEGELGGWIEKEGNLSQDGNAWVSGDAIVSGNARVSGEAEVSGNARVSGNTRVYGDAEVFGDAWVSSNDEVLWISKIGRRLGTTTFFFFKKGIEVVCGCFLGTIEEFQSKVNATHGDSKHGEVYRHAIEIAKLQIGG